MLEQHSTKQLNYFYFKKTLTKHNLLTSCIWESKNSKKENECLENVELGQWSFLFRNTAYDKKLHTFSWHDLWVVGNKFCRFCDHNFPVGQALWRQNDTLNISSPLIIHWWNHSRNLLHFQSFLPIWNSIFNSYLTSVCCPTRNYRRTCHIKYFVSWKNWWTTVHFYIS